jgi:hypothetical protein
MTRIFLGWERFGAYIQNHIQWSRKTFGEGPKVEGIIKHIQKELNEIRENPSNLEEWVDVMILAIDGAWRAGHAPLSIVKMLMSKQLKNRMREWPPISEQVEGQPTEHIR